MAYNRYIKVGGKIYGPYEYSSNRKDGKVVSVYHGKGDEKRAESVKSQEVFDTNNKITEKKERNINPFIVSAFAFFILISLFILPSLFTGKAIGFVSPTLTLTTAFTNNNWVYANISSSSALNVSYLEWANSTGLTNISMANSTIANTSWYYNMTSLADGNYNYTIITQDAANGNWNRTYRRYVNIDTVMPSANIISPQNSSYFASISLQWASNESLSGAWYSMNNSVNKTLANFTDHMINASANGAVSSFVVDLDSDGDMDVLSASQNDNKIAWYKNNGSGSFANTGYAVTTAATLASSVFAIDLDKDGDMDIVGGDYYTVAWYENNGSQTFTAHSINASLSDVNQVYAADMDKDGDIDVLSSCNYECNKTMWYENDGSQNFQWHIINESKVAPVNIYPVDLDEDGDMDVLSASYFMLTWFENNGSQTFINHTIEYSGSIYSGSVYAIDMDKDGDLDVVGGDRTNSIINWYENDGSEKFTVHAVDSGISASNPNSVEAKDFENDGDIDIIVSSWNNNKIIWYENNGSQGFINHTVNASVEHPYSASAADIDKDGDLDIVSASFTDDKIAWFETTQPNTTITATTGSNNLTLFVKDRAGNLNYTPNVIFSVDVVSPIITVNLPRASPNNKTNSTPTINASSSETGCLWYNVNSTTNVSACCSCTSFSASLSNLGGRGFKNITFYANDTVNNKNSTVYYFTVDAIKPVIAINYPPASPNNKTNSTPTIGATISETGALWYEVDSNKTNITGCNNCTSFVSGIIGLSNGHHNITFYANDSVNNFNTKMYNFTADNVIPFLNITYPKNTTYKTISLSLNWTSNETLSGTWYSINNSVNKTLANFTTEINITAIADGANSVYAIDLDKDGDIDVLSASYSDNKIAWYENNGAESFANHTINSSDASAMGVYAIDLDSDDDLDVLAVSSSKLAWYENNGSQGFAIHTLIAGDYLMSSVYAIDLDSDNDIDILYTKSDSNIIEWLENDGSESFTSHTIETTAWHPESVFAIDLDSDGDVDVLSASYLDDKIAWYENDGSETFTSNIISTRADGANSVFAIDLDSDGDVDVLSASTLDNKIAWYENDGSETFTNHTISTSADGATSVYAIDIDSDNDVDVLSASQNDNNIAWYENNGTETSGFARHNISTSARTAKSVFAIDLDSDNDIDVLSASYNDDKIAWYEAKQTNITITAKEGTNNVTVFARDAAGNLNYTRVYFTVDATSPAITFSCSPLTVDLNGLITCSCSATDNIDYNPSVSYTANPSTATAGTLTTTCTATDDAENTATSSAIYTVNTPSGGEEEEPGCTPNCVGKECGSDGCDGSCGACSSGETCSGGSCIALPSCTDDCTSGARECITEASFKTCGNYDSDACYEWGASESCETGKTCSNGACISEAPACSDDCSPSGKSECIDGISFKTCGNYDSDACLEWDAVTSCNVNTEECSAGACVAKSCISNWNCGDWGECELSYSASGGVGGVQERSCVDSAGCEDEQTETQICEIEQIDVDIDVEEFNGETLTRLSDPVSGGYIGTIKKGEREGKPYVDIVLLESMKGIPKRLEEIPEKTAADYFKMYIKWMFLILLLVAWMFTATFFRAYAAEMMPPASIRMPSAPKGIPLVQKAVTIPSVLGRIKEEAEKIREIREETPEINLEAIKEKAYPIKEVAIKKRISGKVPEEFSDIEKQIERLEREVKKLAEIEGTMPSHNLEISREKEKIREHVEKAIKVKDIKLEKPKDMGRLEHQLEELGKSINELAVMKKSLSEPSARHSMVFDERKEHIKAALEKRISHKDIEIKESGDIKKLKHELENIFKKLKELSYQ